MYNMCPIGVRGNKLKGYNKFNVFIYIHNIYIYVRNIYVSYIYICEGKNNFITFSRTR